jgi:sulfonate transport system ATP-binding protein
MTEEITLEPSAPPAVLTARIERKSFAGRVVLENLHLALSAHSTTVILGPSGCGKSTLLRILAGLDSQFQGEVARHGVRITEPVPQIALMFQDVRLLPWKTVTHNLEFAGARGGASRELLTRVGLDAEVGALHPRQLSGGMAKRVALARALASNPELLLLDEPFSDLDQAAKYKLYDLLIAQVSVRTQPLSVLMVTHDIAEAVYLADEVLLLSTERPTTVAARLRIDLPRPRQRQSAEFLSICTSLMGASIADPHSARVMLR